jgi:hypothetical protein
VEWKQDRWTLKPDHDETHVGCPAIVQSRNALTRRLCWNKIGMATFVDVSSSGAVNG